MSMKCDGTLDIHQNFQTFVVRKIEQIHHQSFYYRDFRGCFDKYSMFKATISYVVFSLNTFDDLKHSATQKGLIVQILKFLLWGDDCS